MLLWHMNMCTDTSSTNVTIVTAVNNVTNVSTHTTIYLYLA